MADFKLSPRAQRDIEEIFDYTVAQWGLDQALRYDMRLEAAFVALAKAPLLAESCASIRSGMRRRKIEHHTIYFRTTRAGIAIIRILHERMDAERHL